jgi:hypothetical protein
MTSPKKPLSTWAFEEGTLSVQHLGKTVSLGRYATRELAGKAAALYLAKRADPVAPPSTTVPATVPADDTSGGEASPASKSP